MNNEQNNGAVNFKPIEPAITFKLQDQETPFLQINPNGDCYVKGELVENNRAVFEGFKSWLIEAGFMTPESNK